MNNTKLTKSELRVMLAIANLPKRKCKPSNIKQELGTKTEVTKQLSSLISKNYLEKDKEEPASYEPTPLGWEICDKLIEMQELYYSFFVDRNFLDHNKVKQKLLSDIAEYESEFVRELANTGNEAAAECKLSDGDYLIDYHIKRADSKTERGVSSIADGTFTSPAKLTVRSGKISIQLEPLEANRSSGGISGKGIAKALSYKTENNKFQLLNFIDDKYFILPFEIIHKELSTRRYWKIYLNVDTTVKNIGPHDMLICFDKLSIRPIRNSQDV